MTMNKSTRKTIRKIQVILLAIDSGQKVFFNIAQFESKGLTYSTRNWGTDSAGNKVVIDHTHHLTDKGKQFANIII